jgi:hypothetical protein
MGLGVGVGLLADLNVHDTEGAAWLRESLNRVNGVLEKHGLPPHIEPETLPELNDRACIAGYPYSFLHHLRRFAAHAAQKPNWTPNPFSQSDNPAYDPVVANEFSKARGHLLCHSDCDGYYFPIDFAEPLFADGARVEGGMLGSSYGLMRELVALAPFLGIKLSGGTLEDAEANRINGIIQAQGTFWIELAVWISLFEAARLSIEYRTAICFT